MVSGARSADVVVIGAGLIGLSAARELARAGLRTLIIGKAAPGEASPASAGMLAPSVERSTGPAHDFAVASRDRFPEFLAQLKEESGVSVSLNRLGILQVAVSPAGVKGLRRSVLPGALWIEAAELHKMEPELGHGLGAVFSPNDGAVDNVALLEALRKSISHAGIEFIEDRVTALDANSSGITVATESGAHHSSPYAVVAAGAWASEIAGASLAKEVRPSRGQLVSYDSNPVRHVIYGPSGYLVPREHGHTLAGSTMENVGFDAGTSMEGIEKVKGAAVEICPALGSREPARSWAGLRPVTPDLLPLLGTDPLNPRLVYACGHSRNGVLLAPLTAEIVTDLVVGRGVGFDLTQFRPDRFQY